MRLKHNQHGTRGDADKPVRAETQYIKQTQNSTENEVNSLHVLGLQLLK